MANPVVPKFRNDRSGPVDACPHGSVSGLVQRLHSAYRGAIRDALEMPTPTEVAKPAGTVASSLRPVMLRGIALVHRRSDRAS